LCKYYGRRHNQMMSRCKKNKARTGEKNSKVLPRDRNKKYPRIGKKNLKKRKKTPPTNPPKQNRTTKGYCRKATKKKCRTVIQVGKKKKTTGSSGYLHGQTKQVVGDSRRKKLGPHLHPGKQNREKEKVFVCLIFGDW